MAKLQKKIQLEKKNEISVVNPNAAGIDISPKEMQVCVPHERAEENNRRFGAYTKDLKEISAWLKDVGVTTVAMESTGVYWIPLFRELKQSGFEVILVNARDVKNISGKKTDVSDAEWLMILHRYGLLRPCFQPENKIRELRRLVRCRSGLISSAAREVQHVQKAMEQMNLKLDNAFSDILGKSGQDIIHAIIKGERDPSKLADLADKGCKKSKYEIECSLQAEWNEELVFEMAQYQDLYEYYQTKIQEFDREIENVMNSICAELPQNEGSLVRGKKKTNKKNNVAFDVEKKGFEFWGVNVMAIPGMSKISLLKLMGELGTDFVGKFPDADHFASWANLVPNNKISGGNLLSSKVPKKKNLVGMVFRQMAATLKNSKTAMGDYFRKMRSRGGYLQAMVATGRKLAVVFYTMVQNRTEYDESLYLKQSKSALEAKTKRLTAQLEQVKAELAKY